MFYNLEPHFSVVAVCGLGDKCLGYDSHEMIDEGKEAIRNAAACGCRSLQNIETNKIYVESMGNAESAAEGSAMGIYVFQVSIESIFAIFLIKIFVWFLIACTENESQRKVAIYSASRSAY